MKRPDLRRLAERVLRLEAEAILGLIPKLDANFERAIELLRGSAGRVIVTGMGKSGLVGRKIAATLASTGTPAYFLHPRSEEHTSELQSHSDLVCRLLLEKKNK